MDKYRIENVVCHLFRTAILVDNGIIEGQIGEGCGAEEEEGVGKEEEERGKVNEEEETRSPLDWVTTE